MNFFRTKQVDITYLELQNALVALIFRCCYKENRQRAKEIKKVIDAEFKKLGKIRYVWFGCILHSLCLYIEIVLYLLYLFISSYFMFNIVYLPQVTRMCLSVVY